MRVGRDPEVEETYNDHELAQLCEIWQIGAQMTREKTAMQLDRAKEIVQALADGVDPYTGERFPDDGPYQRADTVRALHAVLEAAEEGQKPKRHADPNKPHAGGKWAPEEEQRLRDAFHAGTPFDEIAANHGRTKGAITSRLVRLGLIDANPANRAGAGKNPSEPEPTTAPLSPPSRIDTPPGCPF